MRTNLKLALTALAASGATAAAVALPAVGAGDDGKPVCPAKGIAGKKAEGGKFKEGIVVPGPSPAELRACLVSKGLNPPDGDIAMKEWIGEQESASGENLSKIKSCFVALEGDPVKAVKVRPAAAD
jgi:hypothetical protein